MRRFQKKKQKKRKARTIDPSEEEEKARRIAAIEAKRQKIINAVKLSLEKRRAERLAIQNARIEKELRARQKATRDAEKSRSEKMMLQIREDLGRIVEAGIKCVYTSVIVPQKIKYDGRGTLSIKGAKYKIKNNLHVVGWGKEAVTMSSAFEKIVGKQLRKGWMVVPRKSISMMWSFPEAFPKLDSRITYVEAGSDGQPDEKSVLATARITDYCKRLKKKDLLIVFLSPDIDDLLCCPRDVITLKDKLRVLQRLKAANASVEEMNLVRNKLSSIRGIDATRENCPENCGDLARLAYPAKVVILVCSDVSEEPRDHLGGGPCAYDPKDERALAILSKYKLAERVPQSVRELLEESVPWTMAADEQLDERKKYKFVYEYVIACNADAMECMAVEAFGHGLFPVKLNSICAGPVQEFAREYVKVASLMVLAVEDKIGRLEMYELMKDSPICPLSDEKVAEIFPAKDKWGLGLCLLLGGRPTVNLCPDAARGGPNQELALYFSLYWYLRTEQYPILRGYTVWFLGGSSYGKDGNTSAAGAYGYKSLATDVYPEYQRAKSAYYAASLEWHKLTEDKQAESEIARAQKKAKELEIVKEKYAAVLPRRVLKENNTNLLFISVNDGDELLELKEGNYYTFTNVGDLHAIRIVRFQCNCDSTCQGNEDRIRVNKEGSVDRALSTEARPKLQYCCAGSPGMH
ncbi:hypothetical protein KM043_010975 [Ampulex compressa]|nr:hypothetical protein KM043_010975 [Ampulex compressa]